MFRVISISSLLFLMVFSQGCATGQLRRIEEEIRILETRLEIFDETFTQAQDESDQTLQQLYINLKRQNDDIQKNQARLNTVLEDLSGETLKTSREMDTLKNKISRLEDRINSAESILKTEVAGTQAEMKQQMQANQAQIDNKLKEVQAEWANVQKQVDDKIAQQVSASESRTKSSIAQLKNEVTGSFKDLERMIRELGGGGGVTAPSQNAEGTVHVISSGETLSGIATKYGVSSNEIIRANNISDPSKIQIGQEIVIPGN